jgi:hypothetical protein
LNAEANCHEADPGRKNRCCKRSEPYADHIDPYMSITMMPANEALWSISALTIAVLAYFSISIWSLAWCRSADKEVREKKLLKRREIAILAAGSYYGREALTELMIWPTARKSSLALLFLGAF